MQLLHVRRLAHAPAVYLCTTRPLGKKVGSLSLYDPFDLLHLHRQMRLTYFVRKGTPPPPPWWQLTICSRFSLSKESRINTLLCYEFNLWNKKEEEEKSLDSWFSKKDGAGRIDIHNIYMREYAPKDRMKGGEIEPLITHPENCGCCYFFGGKGGENQ